MEKHATKANNAPTNIESGSFRPNDRMIRIVLIPVCGIVIPLVTGLIDFKRHGGWELKWMFLYGIAIAFIIWQGNRYLFFSLRHYFDWHKRPIQKIIALLFTITFYTVPLSVILLAAWFKLFEEGIINWNIVLTCTLVIMICVVFITHVYETVFLVKESQDEMLRSAQLDQARVEAELEALKNQIDPHFIFNSLNTLSHLIEEKPGKARQFNNNLADVYRYILQNKGRELVLLREECRFLQQYFSLLKIRFEDAVQLELNIPEAAMEQFLIPPISLQVMLENAIKHNEFSDDKPITISMEIEAEELVIKNPLRPKDQLRESSRIGLDNLDRRYQLTTGRNISRGPKYGIFEVRLPVLNID